MATLLSDNFDRANSTTVVGAPQVGPAPTIDLGAAGISSNQLYASTAVAHVNWDLGTPDVELSMVVNSISGGNAAGLVLGFSGTTADYYLVQALTTGLTLHRNSPGGILTVLASSAIRYPANNGSVLKFSHKNQVLRVYVDGTLVLRWGLDYPMTATKHGIRMATINNRYDNILAVDAPVISEDYVGAVRTDNNQFKGPEFREPSWAYLGRDTKTEDTMAGA